MKKNKEDDGIYRKPTKGFSKRTNMIVGIAFVIFVLVCCIIRLFVQGFSKEKWQVLIFIFSMLYLA